METYEHQEQGSNVAQKVLQDTRLRAGDDEQMHCTVWHRTQLKHLVIGQFRPVMYICKLSLLERLPSPIDKLLNIDREVYVITNSVPAQLLMLPHQVVSHVAQQQHAPLMESPLGHFSTESFVASFCVTA